MAGEFYPAGKFLVVGQPFYREGVLHPVGDVVDLPDGVLSKESIYMVPVIETPTKEVVRNVGVVETPAPTYSEVQAKRPSDAEPPRKK